MERRPEKPIEITKNKQEHSLEEFRAKIDKFKKLEEETKNSAHLINCNPDELEIDEMNFFNEFMLDKLTIEIFKETKNKLLSKNKNKSQKDFYEFIGNKFAEQISNNLPSSIKKKGAPRSNTEYFNL